MRYVVRVGSIVLALLYAALIVIGLYLRDWTDGAPPPHPKGMMRILSDIHLSLPFIYFGICFGTSFAQRRRQVRNWGIVAHMILAVVYIVLLLSIRKAAALLVMVRMMVPAVVCALIWWQMYLSLSPDGEEEKNQQDEAGPA